MFRPEARLYPYQQDAADAMQESNVLLAHEMGLGKTATTLFAIEAMRPTRPGTIVVPSSLKWQWAREVAKFTDRRPMVIDGTPKEREARYAYIANSNEIAYMITTYDLFVRDWAKHGNIANAFLVCDEATALKNFKTKRSKHFKKVQGNYPVRFALTGTPIENGKAEEIYSIFDWLDPKLLGPWWSFEKRYVQRNSLGWIEGYRNLDDFHRRLKPYVLRATFKQPEVAKYLPKVQHMAPLLVDMDQRTRRAVEWITDDILSDLDSLASEVSMAQVMSTQDEDHPDGRLMAKIQVLRMLLDHPEAVRISARDHGDTNGKFGSAYAKAIVDDQLLMGVEQTPKMDATVDYVEDFLEISPDNKAVVFSSFVSPARELQRRFGHKAVLFTGSLSSKERDAVKQRFVSDPDVRVFVSTDAGGYGLDLPQANLLVNFNQPWQAGMLKQRNARIRRASSTWGHVTIQDVVVAGTIEERMLAMLSHKAAVADAIVDGEGIDDDGLVTSTLESLRTFLTDQVESRFNYA